MLCILCEKLIKGWTRQARLAVLEQVQPQKVPLARNLPVQVQLLVLQAWFHVKEQMLHLVFQAQLAVLE